MDAKDLSTYSPVLILGFPRSGTTALLQGLIDLPGFCGRNDREGHLLYWLLDGFREVAKTRGSRFRSARAKWALSHDEEAWSAIKESTARSVCEIYWQLGEGEGRWVDKTPNVDSVRIAPTVAEIFPSARFIFAVRNPLDALYSFKQLCRREGFRFRLGAVADQWVELQREWRKRVRDQLPPDSYLQIKQETLATEPQKVARQLGRLLQLEPAQAQQLGSFFETKKVYSMFGSGARKWSHADSWSESDRRLILDVCAPEMRVWRYLEKVPKQSLAPGAAARRGLHATRRSLKKIHRSLVRPRRAEGDRATAKGGAVKPQSAHEASRLDISAQQLEEAYDKVSQLYPHVPSLSLWRAWEYAGYRRYDLPEPILDLGCGDGAYFRLVWPGKSVVVGADREPGVAGAASRSGVYRGACLAAAQDLPFRESFASVFSNCALEHMDDLGRVLAQVHSCLRPGGTFLLSVITDRLEEWFDAPWLAGAADEETRAVRQRELFMSHHHHVNSMPIPTWLETLESSGFRIEGHTPIVPEQTGRVFLQLDTLWHTPTPSGEAGAGFAAHLRQVNSFPGAFGGIVRSLYAMETGTTGYGGVIVCARKPA